MSNQFDVIPPPDEDAQERRRRIDEGQSFFACFRASNFDSSSL